jgi:hypothetical protein
MSPTMKTAMKLLFVLFAATTLGACAAQADDASLPSDEKVDVDTDTNTTTPSYGSTFNSNCYCSFCVKYCTVDGQTYKNGTCC